MNLQQRLITDTQLYESQLDTQNKRIDTRLCFLGVK